MQCTIFYGILQARMRCFLALTPPRPIVSAMRSSVRSLEADRAFQPTAITDVHLTLWFFGNVSDQEAAALQTFCVRCARSVRMFPVKPERWDTFPNHEHAKTLVIHTQVTPELATLRMKLELKLRRFTGKPSFVFQPHLTLGRWSKPVNAHRIGILKQRVPDWAFLVRRISLYESQPRPSGSHYRFIQSFPLST